ncbi:hypothetical protein RhiirB3_486262 [Rhizophagus irregularis]|nr:hypothetical protein RhiirB3_486262 [Rhizophagus irregularis]
MSKQFFSGLSQNYIEILEDDEYYDVTIEVGEDPNVKIFRAHMIILCYRSPFLRRTLSSNKKNGNSVLTHIKFSNISPEIFQIVLSQNYIEILEDDEYYDVTIEVGEDPNVKIFRAHMIVLCYRSPFLRRTLASNKKNDNDKYI